MRLALRPDHTSLRRLRSLLALFLLTAPGCGAPPAETDLVGRVEDTSGAPMSGVLVHAGDTLTTAATDGSFEITGVPVPYTLTVASTVGDPWVHAFDGLTSATPSVVPPQLEPPTMQATLSGDAWGGNPVPAGRRVRLCVEGRDFVVWGCRVADEGDVTYDLPVVWSGATNASLRVHALYLSVDGDDLPTGYTGLRHADATVTAGSNTDLDLSPNLLLGAASTAQVTIAAGAGTVEAAVVAVRVADRLVQTIYRGPWPGGTVDVALPPVAVASGYQVTAWVAFPSGLTAFAWGLADAGEAIDVAVPSPPQLLAPAPGAANVTSDTVFRAIGGDSAAKQFYWEPTGATDGPRVRLTTSDAMARLPDVGIVGTAYPAGGTYDWIAIDLFVPDYEDAVALRVGHYDLAGIGGAGHATDGAIVQSEDRPFTLAP